MWEGTAQTGILAGLILCTLRHYNESQSLETVRLIDQFRASLPVVGFDIAADEAGFPLDQHLAAFAWAHAHNIPCTARAGEACGPASVWQTLQQLRPQRIGHGVRSIEDPELVEHLRATRMHLEICPTSNVQTNTCRQLLDHPVDQLFRAGVPLSVKTDARTISNVNLYDEYATLHRTFGWTPTELL